MSISLGTMKRGDTFNYYATWEGALIDELTSQVRTGTGRLLSVVEIAPTQTPDTFQMTVNDTTHWPIGTVYTDIERFVNGAKISTATLELEILRDVTMP